MNSIVYGVAISPKKPGETPIYRHPKAVKALWKPKILTMQGVWEESVKKFSGRKCLNELTYVEVDQKASRLGSWMVENNHKLIYIHSRNRVEWVLADIACWKYGIINVPLYDTLGK
jgi:long-subunit acyl-CoA synthetase (AMP-forming)